MTSPGLSVVVPVHNEAALLPGAVHRLRCETGDPEVILVENGSTDDTPLLAWRLARDERGRIRAYDSRVGDYGLALRYGLGLATAPLVLFTNLDLPVGDFLLRALPLMDQADLVLGSKVRGVDRRPWLRRAVTWGFNRFLRLAFGLRASDTHGMKLLRRDTVRPLAEACVTCGWLWDTELVLRCERAGLRIDEVPVEVHELRGHGLGALTRRVPGVLMGLVRMWRALRRPTTSSRATATQRVV